MCFWKYIDKKVGNNVLSYDKRKNLWSKVKLYVPSILDVWEISLEKLDKYLSIGKKIVFEEVLNWKLFSQVWLQNYIVWTYKNSKICIFDNHNLSFYFIAKFFLETWKKLDLIHIDQHSDLYEPYYYPEKLDTLKDVEKYTFEWINVWSWIKPLKKIWFINQDIQLRTELSVLEYNFEKDLNIILDIDLDFWEENMTTTMKSLTKLKKIIWIVPLVTIATSPYFLDQEKALKLIRNLFA
jgi:hypothetical protein